MNLNAFSMKWTRVVLDMWNNGFQVVCWQMRLIECRCAVEIRFIYIQRIPATRIREDNQLDRWCYRSYLLSMRINKVLSLKNWKHFPIYKGKVRYIENIVISMRKQIHFSIYNYNILTTSSHRTTKYGRKWFNQSKQKKLLVWPLFDRK